MLEYVRIKGKFELFISDRNAREKNNKEEQIVVIIQPFSGTD